MREKTWKPLRTPRTVKEKRLQAKNKTSRIKYERKPVEPDE